MNRVESLGAAGAPAGDAVPGVSEEMAFSSDPMARTEDMMPKSAPLLAERKPSIDASTSSRDVSPSSWRRRSVIRERMPESTSGSLSLSNTVRPRFIREAIRSTIWLSLWLAKTRSLRRSYTLEFRSEHRRSRFPEDTSSPARTFSAPSSIALHMDTTALWLVRFMLLRFRRTLSTTVAMEPTTSASMRMGSSSAVTGTDSMNAYPSMNGKCRGELRSWTVRNTVVKTTAMLTNIPRKGSISARYDPTPSMHVNSIRVPVFQSGLTDRSLWSIMRAMTTMATPTRELTWPNTFEMIPTTTHMARKNRVLLATLFISMAGSLRDPIF